MGVPQVDLVCAGMPAEYARSRVGDGLVWRMRCAGAGSQGGAFVSARGGSQQSTALHGVVGSAEYC